MTNPDLNKEFVIASLTRQDLMDAGMPRSKVTKLSDEDMQAIARKMGDYYVEYGGYWEHAQDAADYVLGRKLSDQSPGIQ